MSKSQSFKAASDRHEELLKKLTEYIQSFTISEYSYEVIEKIRVINTRNKNARN